MCFYNSHIYVYVASETPIHQNLKFWQMHPSEIPIGNSDGYFYQNAKFWQIYPSKNKSLNKSSDVRNSNWLLLFQYQIIVEIFITNSNQEVWLFHYRFKKCSFFSFFLYGMGAPLISKYPFMWLVQVLLIFFSGSNWIFL